MSYVLLCYRNNSVEKVLRHLSSVRKWAYGIRARDTRTNWDVSEDGIGCTNGSTALSYEAREVEDESTEA